MAKPSGVTIDIRIGIPGEVADLCRKVLEMYLNQTPELKLVSRKLPDGSVRLALEADYGDEIVRVKRPEEMSPDHRQELGL